MTSVNFDLNMKKATFFDRKTKKDITVFDYMITRYPFRFHVIFQITFTHSIYPNEMKGVKPMQPLLEVEYPNKRTEIHKLFLIPELCCLTGLYALFF